MTDTSSYVPEYSGEIPGTSVLARVSSYDHVAHKSGPLMVGPAYATVWNVSLITDDDSNHNLYGWVLDLSDVPVTHAQVARGAFILWEKELLGETS